MPTSKGTLRLILEEVGPGPATTLEATFNNGASVDVDRISAAHSVLSIEKLKARLQQMLSFIEHCEKVRQTL